MANYRVVRAFCTNNNKKIDFLKNIYTREAGRLKNAMAQIKRTTVKKMSACDFATWLSVTPQCHRERIFEAIVYHNVVIDDTLSSTTKHVPLFTRWERPPIGYFKLNVDASTDGTYGFVGAVIRNDVGDVIPNGFLSRTLEGNISTSGEAELKAASYSIGWAAQLQVRKLYIDTDNIGVMKKLTGQIRVQESELESYEEIWSRLDGFDDFVINHTYREANRTADFLARSAMKNTRVPYDSNMTYKKKELEEYIEEDKVKIRFRF